MRADGSADAHRGGASQRGLDTVARPTTPEARRSRRALSSRARLHGTNPFLGQQLFHADLDERLQNADQWPDPWLSLNPSFATGGTPHDHIAEGTLEPECEQIFRLKNHSDDAGRDPIVFHRHQRDAIETARTGASYVLTTGTGSGKSLAYIVPIVDRILKERASARPGVKAIVVYPMNALANSQVEELRKFLHYGFAPSERLVSFARYTGQESPDLRREAAKLTLEVLARSFQRTRRREVRWRGRGSDVGASAQLWRACAPLP